MKTDKQQRSLHYGYVIVACCCLMMGINIGLTFSCAGIFYQPVSKSLGVPVGEFGLYMSIMYVTSTLMLSVAGTMLEKYSARMLFSLNSLVMGLCFVLMALARHVWEFYLAGGVLGVTLAFLLYLSFPTLVNRWFHTRVGMMIGICSAASGIGGVVFNPIAGKIISEYGWRWGYGAFAIIIIFVVTPLLALLLRDNPSDKGLLPYGADSGEANDASSRNDQTPGISFRSAIRMPAFYTTVLFAFLMMGISTLNLFIPGYVSSHGFTLAEASLAASAVMAGVTVGKIALGYINDRNCAVGVMVTTLFGVAGLMSVVNSTGSLMMILSGAFLFGWAYAGVTVQTAMLTRTIFGSADYARIYSVISIALAGGGALASGGWGMMVDAVGYSTTFGTGSMALLMCMLAGGYGLWSARRTTRRATRCMR